MAALVLFTTILVGVQALPRISSWNRYAADVLEDASSRGVAQAAEVDGTSSLRWFTQKLDHYDHGVDEAWQQRSFQNTTFFNGSGPVFLCIGGEGPAMDESVLVSSVHCNDMAELAPRAGALMVAVEHRYYGSSLPKGRDFSTKSLKWLSSRQALGDLAEFHAQITANYSLGEQNKWVSFGGSYPGMLSGFFRLKFPHLVHAAVSSSSPMKAKIDMQEYQDLVGDSLAVESVGGSAECRRVVAEGHQAGVGELIKTEDGRAQLALAFNFCDPGGALSSEAAAGEWAAGGVIEVPSQENDPSCTAPACDIGSICGLLLGEDGSNASSSSDLSDVDRLVLVSRAQQGGRCLVDWTRRSRQSGGSESSSDLAKAFDPGAQKTAKALVEAEKRGFLVVGGAARRALVDEASPARSWPYQTCTEFGFYQTCEFGSRCPFVQGYNNLSQQVSMCELMFGISEAQVRAAVKLTNEYYGADKPEGTRILFPNGNVDPWSGLGVLDSPNPADEPTMLVEGASHHFWTHPHGSITQPAVAEAKAAIQAQVLEWLQESP